MWIKHLSQGVLVSAGADFDNVANRSWRSQEGARNSDHVIRGGGGEVSVAGLSVSGSLGFFRGEQASSPSGSNSMTSTKAV